MSEVAVIFNSRDERFKQPYGAVPAGTVLSFHVLISRQIHPERARLVLLYDEDKQPVSHEMDRRQDALETDSYDVFSVSVPVERKGLYWYYFETDTNRGMIQIGRNDEDHRAVLASHPASWQQTVYERTEAPPDWICGGVFYHIFVDRFYHAGKRVEMEGKVLRQDWGGMPEYRPQNGRILNNDFFGGNLEGIIEKLPYLEQLGVTCLYLSPVFSAYSNHKYDTSDYMSIDPMFGTEETFRQLCEQAGLRGMRVICDGVFSHTGSDSIYFDRNHRYGNGAYENPDSPYRDWYYFQPGEAYDTWWGIDTLPRLNKENESYRHFITGEDGVVRHWLRAGAAGWRLDVADELPNSFLTALHDAAKAEKNDALIVGEVWEDASNKVSYDERKNYFQGDRIDSVMNYPFREGIIAFVRYGNAWKLHHIVSQILEHYPEDVVHYLMNILGTHDSVRILTALAGDVAVEDADRETQAAVRLSPAQREEGIRLLKIAVVVQMTLPGVPCIYYGDEAGTEGYKDPFNRTCYPWGSEDQTLLHWYRRLIGIRREHHVYRKGKYRTMAAIEGLFAFERYDPENNEVSMITAANCGERDAELLLEGEWKDLLTGQIVRQNTTLFPGEVLLLEEMK